VTPLRADGFATVLFRVATPEFHNSTLNARAGNIPEIQLTDLRLSRWIDSRIPARIRELDSDRPLPTA